MFCLFVEYEWFFIRKVGSRERNEDVVDISDWELVGNGADVEGTNIDRNVIGVGGV